MNLSDIQASDWEYIFKKHPGVQETILACGLHNEMLRLNDELNANVFIDPRRKEWVESRLKELLR